MVRNLETGGCSTNGDHRRRRQEREIIDFTQDDEDDFVTPPETRRRMNQLRTLPVTLEYEPLSLAQPGTYRGVIRPTPRRAPPPSPPPPSPTEPKFEVPEYVPEARLAPHNDVVVFPQCRYLFIAFLYTATSSFLNMDAPDPVESLNFDWNNDVELGDPTETPSKQRTPTGTP
ncbi:hypothetical protein ZOSMA_37G01470 [Zostera marina]|uniref:Uncharacterized protein n=1 Tax=Zostera marina TaxID=29655 RepID=A0A0K9P5F4_ZOSMR|nr:hypothetical protein ZOSMA_37G01470 [Zostera marina]